jgi:hypothetical protein
MTRMFLTTTLALLTLSACSSATLVRKDRVGGRIVLDGAYMPAAADARLLMAEHCGGRVDIAEIGNALEFRCRGAEGAEVLASGGPAANGGEL